MSSPKFSADLFEQLGGSNWRERSVFFENQPLQKSMPLNDDESLNDSPESGLLFDGESETNRVEEVVVALEQSPMSVDRSTANTQDSVGLILIGSGLNSIWEDEDQLEWQLWLNICEALNWPEDQIVYYDTEALISEEMLFATMEEIVESGVDCVLSMQSDSELSEQLSEGLQVIEVPSLQDMLVDPYAKQSFYQSVVTSVNLS